MRANLSTRISQLHNHAQSIKVKNQGGPLDYQTCQTEWKTAPLAKVQSYEYENQTLEAFVAASRLSAKFDCPVARQNLSILLRALSCFSLMRMIVISKIRLAAIETATPKILNPKIFHVRILAHHQCEATVDTQGLLRAHARAHALPHTW